MRRFEVMTIAIVSSIMTSILITGAIAVANYKAVPDTVPRLIPYRGNLDLNGEPYNGSLDMTFGLYHAATAGEAVWTETQNVTVYGGKFSALLGNSNAQSVENLTDVVTGGDDLYLEVSLNGEVLQGRQRFFPAPFALWTTASTDFNVDHDLTVGNDLSVSRNASVQNDLAVNHNTTVQNDITVNRHAKVNGTLTLGGTDLMFGPHATRGDGGRVLVHNNNDSLVINFGNDFPGGTTMQGDFQVTGTQTFADKPFHLKRFSSIGVGWTDYNTEYSTTDWGAAIVGFRAEGGDIDEGSSSGSLITVQAVATGGTWHIVADFRSHINNETWAADVLFIKKGFVSVVGY